MTIKGRIHSVETFGTVDGPGIRYIVFMQGCPLRCLYCHNRDSWNPKGGKEITVEEIITDLQKYREFIDTSGGGITVTGGEPTLQSDFVAELFNRCKEIGIHTVLDTSGYVDLEKAKKLLLYTDLVLLDIKHAKNEKHKIITGVNFDKIHKFSYYLSDNNIPIWIRYVLLPNYTDGEDDLIAASNFIKKLKNVEKIEVLPYHSLGEYKWTDMGEKYTLANFSSPSEKEINYAIKILNSNLPNNNI